MSDFLPIVDGLIDCQSHGERARWLLACPLSFMKSHSLEIRNVLRRAGFVEGVAYVEAENVSLDAVRDPNGDHTKKTSELLQASRDRLWMISLRTRG